jgi:hypothetical protein
MKKSTKAKILVKALKTKTGRAVAKVTIKNFLKKK